LRPAPPDPGLQGQVEHPNQKAIDGTVVGDDTPEGVHLAYRSGVVGEQEVSNGKRRPTPQGHFCRSPEISFTRAEIQPSANAANEEEDVDDNDLGGLARGCGTSGAEGNRPRLNDPERNRAGAPRGSFDSRRARRPRRALVPTGGGGPLGLGCLELSQIEPGGLKELAPVERCGMGRSFHLRRNGFEVAQLAPGIEKHTNHPWKFERRILKTRRMPKAR
jgi:hypothetical protein